jgi:two-component system phosphate regulon sensor histidine kinase PhoR
MRRSDRPGRAHLAGRLLTLYGLTVVLLILLFGAVTAIAVAVSGEDVRAVQITIGVTGAAAIAVGMGIGVLLVRRVSRPIQELTELADALAAGTLDVSPRRSSVAEIDRLGVAIGHIASDLGRRIEETEAERRTLDVVLSAMTQGVMLVGDGEQIEYANPAATELLGRVPERLRMVAPRAVARLVRRALESGETAVEAVDHGVPRRVLRIAATPLPRGDRVLLVVADVTERERIEAMRRDFVADASHELKTPVSSILASVETLEMALDRDPEAVRRFTRQIDGSARQLARIVADLLDLSRLEAGTPEMEEIAFHGLVREEAERHRDRAREKGVDFVVTVEPVAVLGSPADLGLAVRNLCDNAVRYTDAGGRVEVSLRADAAHAVVTVSDTGAGIPTRDLPRIFERFYRVDVARSRATGGTGLGLSIVRHVAERHGGSVAVESRLGLGSTFTLSLPRLASSGADRPVAVEGGPSGL